MKSDDVVGRVKTYEAIVKGEEIQRPACRSRSRCWSRSSRPGAGGRDAERERGGDPLHRGHRQLSAAGPRWASTSRDLKSSQGAAPDVGRHASHRSITSRSLVSPGHPSQVRPSAAGVIAAHAGSQQLRRHPHQPGLARSDQGLVVGRGHQAGDDQLPHAQAGEGRPLRRAHLRSHQGLGVLLRQVQAHPLQGDHLRQVRRGGHPLQGAPRADGPHQAGQPRQPHLVLQGHAVAARHPARHQPAQPGADPLLRPVRGHPRRRGRAREGDRRASTRRWPSASPPPSRWSRRSAPSSRAPIGDKRAEVEAAYEADVRRHDERFTARSEELATAAQQVEASIKEGGKTVAEDVVFAPTGEVIVARRRDVQGRADRPAQRGQGRDRGRRHRGQAGQGRGQGAIRPVRRRPDGGHRRGARQRARAGRARDR